MNHEKSIVYLHDFFTPRKSDAQVWAISISAAAVSLYSEAYDLTSSLCCHDDFDDDDEHGDDDHYHLSPSSSSSSSFCCR